MFQTSNRVVGKVTAKYEGDFWLAAAGHVIMPHLIKPISHV